MKKILIGGVIVVLLAVGFGLFYLVSNLDDIVAGLIENHGSRVTGTRVAVSGVDIALRDGRAAMTGLTIDSPDGYDARRAFSLGEIVVDIDVESLRDDPIVIEEIKVAAPVVSAEINEDGSSNITAINDHVQAFSARFQTEGGEGGGSDQGAEDQKRIRIKRFVFEEGRIEVDASDLGVEARTVTLPSIQLDDIGGPQGALPDGIAKAVLGSLTRKAVEAVAKAEIESRAREALKDEAEEQGKKLLDKLGG